MPQKQERDDSIKIARTMMGTLARETSEQRCRACARRRLVYIVRKIKRKPMQNRESNHGVYEDVQAGALVEVISDR